jgi:2-oxoacid dehydrogenase/acyltransferase catalytic subunit
LVQAIAASCKAEPSLNAWYDSEVGRRRLLTRVDVGLSIDLEGVLIVPVLRNVRERDSADLPARLERMRADAAACSIPPEELRGATITLSNFGMIGGRFASLIVVPPQKLPSTAASRNCCSGSRGLKAFKKLHGLDCDLDEVPAESAPAVCSPSLKGDGVCRLSPKKQM